MPNAPRPRKTLTSSNFLKIFCGFAVRQASFAALVGRKRDRRNPAKGRFSREEADNILQRVWHEYDQLTALAPAQPNPGNQIIVLLACFTFAYFKVLLSAGIEREYVVELIGDMTWKMYEQWGRLPFFLACLSTRDPRERMRVAFNLFMRFPFSSPGYAFKRLPSGEGLSLDMLKCLAAEYFQKWEAADLCIGAWCGLDFALAESWGGWLERTETLAMGCARCNFRFKANAISRFH